MGLKAFGMKRKRLTSLIRNLNKTKITKIHKMMNPTHLNGASPGKNFSNVKIHRLTMPNLEPTKNNVSNTFTPSSNAIPRKQPIKFTKNAMATNFKTPIFPSTSGSSPMTSLSTRTCSKKSAMKCQ